MLLREHECPQTPVSPRESQDLGLSRAQVSSNFAVWRPNPLGLGGKTALLYFFLTKSVKNVILFESRWGHIQARRKACLSPTYLG